MSMVSRTALTLLAGLIAVPFTPVNRTATNNAPEQQAAPTAYAVTAKEAYLAPEALTYIRPGLNIKIQAGDELRPRPEAGRRALPDGRRSAGRWTATAS